MNNVVYDKTLKNWRNTIDLKLVNTEKDYLKCTSKPNYMSHKIFDNNLVGTRKSKVSSKVNEPAYTGMCTLELSKVSMYGFHYDYIKNKYEIKTEDVHKDFSSNKERFDFSIYSTTMIIQIN